MAKQTIVTLIDDLDGSEASESVTFSYRGVDYTIDLNAKNTAAFDRAVSKYIDAATRGPARKATPRTGPAATAGRRADLTDIRAWANANGHEVSSRGRIPAQVVHEYDARRRK